MYLSLEKLEANLEFWRGLLIVSSSALESLRNERSIGISAYAAQSRANANVKAEITRLLAGKTYDQLVTLQGQVQRKLSSGEPVDVDYWEGLLKELIVWKSKGKLRDMHEVVLNNRLEQLRRKQRDEAVRLQDEIKYALPAAKEVIDEEEEDMEIEEEIVQEDWDPTLEPTMMSRIPEELRGAEIVEEGEDRERLVSFLPSPLLIDIDVLGFAVRSTTLSGANSIRHQAKQARRRSRRRRRPETSRRKGRGNLPSRRRTRVGRRGGIVQYGGGDVEAGVYLGGQIPTTKAEIFLQDSFWIRVEQIRSDALRVSLVPFLLSAMVLTKNDVQRRQSSTESHSRIQIQHLLPRSHQQRLSAKLQSHQDERRRRHLRHSLQRRTALRRSRVQDCEQGLGVLA